MLDLLLKLKEKDDKSIKFLYENYGKKLYGYAISQWKLNEDDAWELIYKTLYKVIETYDNYLFENENRFIGFLFKVFTNYLRNHIRDSKNKQLFTTELTDNIEITTQDDIENEGLESPLMICMKKVLEALDDWQRILLLMKAQNFSYQDIAPYVNKPHKQLKVYNLRLRNSVTKKTNLCIENKGYE